ncbi:MAG TPA: hypothetical protein VKC64_00715 [Burkholderiales bacterium]|nr:hypothetical protein [Burkholderiales bacterium]
MQPCHRIVAALLAASVLAGCAGQAPVVGGAVAPAVPASSVVVNGGLTASFTFEISSAAANALFGVALVGFLIAGNNVYPVRWTPMREDRAINQQDCTKPIADMTANLKCR